MSLRSVGEISPHDPREFDVGPALEDAAVATVDMAALRALARETEIDFTELRENVNRTLEGKDGAPASATVADVLELHPATQGWRASSDSSPSPRSTAKWTPTPSTSSAGPPPPGCTPRT